jgi:hypothetical protein
MKAGCPALVAPGPGLLLRLQVDPERGQQPSGVGAGLIVWQAAAVTTLDKSRVIALIVVIAVTPGRVQELAVGHLDTEVVFIPRHRRQRPAGPLTDRAGQLHAVAVEVAFLPGPGQPGCGHRCPPSAELTGDNNQLGGQVSAGERARRAGIQAPGQVATASLCWHGMPGGA